MRLKQFPMSHQRGKMTLMIVKQLSMLPKRGTHETDEKIYKETKLEPAIEIEKQVVEDEKKIIKSELE